VTRSTVWGWASPWSGDEKDPTPRSYWWWHRLYRFNQRLWHLLRWCDWHPVQSEGGRVFYRCDWCGRTR